MIPTQDRVQPDDLNAAETSALVCFLCSPSPLVYEHTLLPNSEGCHPRVTGHVYPALSGARSRRVVIQPNALWMKFPVVELTVYPSTHRTVRSVLAERSASRREIAAS